MGQVIFKWFEGIQSDLSSTTTVFPLSALLIIRSGFSVSCCSAILSFLVRLSDFVWIYFVCWLLPDIPEGCVYGFVDR